MTLDETTELLARGGMVLSAAKSGAAEYRECLPRYSGLSNPSGTERLGIALAAAAFPSAPDVVMAWDTAEDLVLAYVIARETDARVIRAFNCDGLLGQDGTMSPGDRVLLVADAFRDEVALRAMHALVTYLGGQVTGAAALVGTKVMAEICGPSAFVLLSPVGPCPVPDGHR